MKYLLPDEMTQAHRNEERYGAFLTALSSMIGAAMSGFLSLVSEVTLFRIVCLVIFAAAAALLTASLIKYKSLS